MWSGDSDHQLVYFTAKSCHFVIVKGYKMYLTLSYLTLSVICKNGNCTNIKYWMFTVTDHQRHQSPWKARSSSGTLLLKFEDHLLNEAVVLKWIHFSFYLQFLTLWWTWNDVSPLGLLTTGCLATWKFRLVTTRW